MNLPDLLLAEHSRAQTDRIMAWVGNSQVRFDELFAFFCGDDQHLAQRAAWPLSYLVIAEPARIKKHWKKLLENVKKNDRHPAIRRNTLRLMQDISIPGKYKGEVMTFCFDVITSPLEKPAAKAFALTVLENLMIEYPEIAPELKLIIESQWANESKAFRSRAKKLLRHLP